MSKKDKDIKGDNSGTNIELVLLKSIYSDYELNIVKNLLEENDIPYIIKDRGIGGYMRIITGSSMYETDIFVEKSMLEQSLNILDEFPW